MTTMTTNQKPAPVRTGHIGRRILRGLARGVGIVLALIAGLALAGVGYEVVASRGDARTFPPPGRLVDVGGYWLHIQCAGTGNPTVVLDAGLGGTSLDWSLVQPEIGLTTRVCAYDRAGMGWSEPGPLPRTPEHIARELHTLLTNADIPGPYVLVGHSLGGKNVRMFALLYPDQVAGLVLVDARSEYVDARTSPAEARAFQQMVATQGSVFRLARGLGLMRLFGASVVGAPGLSTETRTSIAMLAYSPRSLATGTAEAGERAADDARLQLAPSLGDRPLLVLASEHNMTATPYWAEAQQQLAGLSTQGRLIVPAGSSHYIQWDHPAMVIDAIRQVVGQVRGD